MAYRLKGTLKIVVRRIVEIEVDELVDATYITEAMDIVEDKFLTQVKANNSGCASVDVWSNEAINIARVKQ